MGLQPLAELAATDLPALSAEAASLMQAAVAAALGGRHPAAHQRAALAVLAVAGMGKERPRPQHFPQDLQIQVAVVAVME
jgi:hypothetical protein